MRPDASDRPAAELAETRRLFQMCTELLCTARVDGWFELLNPAWESVLGWTLDELRSRPYLEFVHPDDRERTIAVAGRALEGRADISTFENRYMHRDGSWRWLSWSARAEAGVWYAVARDVTATRELERQVSHDPLTGLPNRVALTALAGKALQRALDRDATVALFFIDLDRFKLANDTFGHRLGDRLLIAACERLQDAVRAGDVVGRLSGDEFVVIADGMRDPVEADLLATRLVHAFARPLVVDGERIPLSASVGVALAPPGEPISAEQLLHEADTAMYRAKARGRGRHARFDEEMRAEVEARREVASELRHALERGELWVAYQPIVALSDGTVAGVEALARWNSRLHGDVRPAEFIDMAEEHGLMGEIGEWMLRTACGQAARWRRDGAAIGVAVNVAPSQLLDENFPDLVAEVLENCRLPAAALSLEVVEATVVSRANVISLALARLKRLGVRIALDDFGKGATSLSYFRNLPLDEVKLDREFVVGLRQGTVNRAIVAALVSRAEEMSLALVAEGIESEDELTQLRSLGCRLAQGYWFARPRPASQLDLSGYQSQLRPGLGDPSVIREFMRQIGLPARIA